MVRGERIELSQSDLKSNSPILGTLPRLKVEPEVRFELTKLSRRFTKPILLATKGLRLKLIFIYYYQ